MKYILTILLFFISISLFAQYPIQQSLGSATTQVTAKGAIGAKDGIVWTRYYADTASANLQPYISGIAGFVIRVGASGTDFFVRNEGLTQWVQINGGSSGSQTLQEVFDVESKKAILTGTDTMKLSTNKFMIQGSSGTEKLDIDYSRLGGGGNPGAYLMDNQNFAGTILTIRGKDPGFVKAEVINTTTPTEAAAAGISYGTVIVGVKFQNSNNSGQTQIFKGAGQNFFCDSCTHVGDFGSGLKMSASSAGGRIRFQIGSNTEAGGVISQFNPNGHLLINTATDIGGKWLNVPNSVYFGDSLMLSNLLTGTSSDSVLVTSSNGVTKRILQSALVGATPTLQQVITAGTTMTQDNTIVNGANTLEITNNTLAADYGVRITSNSTAASAGSQILFNVELSGANASASEVTEAAAIYNIHTGSGENHGLTTGASGNTTNISLYSTGTGGTTAIGGKFLASGATNNYSIDLGNAGTSKGTMRINGNTSGSIVIQPAAAAGTYTLTLPTTDGNASEFLQTDGSGVLTWAAASASVTWNGISNPTGDQALTFDAGESSTWTNSNTTEDLFTVNTSTLTTSSLFSLNSTGTALASGNNLMELVMSGANGSSSITATGARISVTNTGTTNTNIALDATATGAATDNWAVNATGNIKITSANTSQVTTSAGLNLNANSLTTGTGFYAASSTLSSGKMIDIAVTGTAGLTNQTGLNVSLSGANGTGAQTTYGGIFSNTHTGTSVNVGAEFIASGGSTNTAIRVASGNGRVAIGQLNANASLDVVGSAIIDAIQTSSTGGNSSFFVVAATGFSGTSTTGAQLLGSTNVDFRVLLNGTTASTGNTGRPYFTQIIGASAYQEPGSGTVTAIGSLALRAPTITAGAGAVTTGVTFYIEGATSPAGAAAYAMWIDDGVARLDGGILGTATNDNATAGNTGEYVSSLIASGSAVSLTTATAANITSISLTAGDWDVTGTVSFTETTATVSARSAGLTSTSATVPTDGSEAFCGVQSTITSETNSITPARKRFSLSGTTTIYLVGSATFSAGTCAGFGNITARRIR